MSARELTRIKIIEDICALRLNVVQGAKLVAHVRHVAGKPDLGEREPASSAETLDKLTDHIRIEATVQFEPMPSQAI